jgi:hypothetical protein
VLRTKHGSEAVPPEKLHPGDNDRRAPDHRVDGFEALLLAEPRDSFDQEFEVGLDRTEIDVLGVTSRQYAVVIVWHAIDRARWTVDGWLSMVDPATDEGTLPSWENALATVAACGVVGAFIDFYIGKPGQQRVRSWLETWWLRLSYVRWVNFGREEALLAVQVIDRLFGRRLFSVRRITAVAVITSASLCVILSLYLFNQMPIFVFWKNFIKLGILFDVILIVLSVATSLSITCFAASRVASLITKAPFLNLLGFAFLLVFQYAMLAWWSPIMISTHNLIADIPLFNEIQLRYHSTYVEGRTWYSSPQPKILRSPLSYVLHLEVTYFTNT